MKTRRHFAFLDIWDDSGDSIVEHVAGVDDFEVAEATYRAAVARWPLARITLRQGARVVYSARWHDSLMGGMSGAGAGVRHDGAARAARPTSFCLAAEPLCGTPR